MNSKCVKMFVAVDPNGFINPWACASTASQVRKIVGVNLDYNNRGSLHSWLDARKKGWRIKKAELVLAEEPIKLVS